MQQERLRISGFAGLDGAEIDLGRVNLFIGPQASGKSVTAKVLYFIKSFCDMALHALTQDKAVEEFLAMRLLQFDRYFPPTIRTLKAFRVEYSFKDTSMVIEGGKTGMVTITAPVWERVYREAYAECKRVKGSLPKKAVEQQFALTAQFKKVLGSQTPTPQLFICDGRGSQTCFEDVLKAVSFKTQDLRNPFMAEYLGAYASINQHLANQSADWWMSVADEVMPILQGTPFTRDGETYIRSKDGRDVPLAFASSGQKEMLPILKILLLLSTLSYCDTKPTVTIEEPETHLSPEAQVRLVSLMASCLNRAQAIQAVITTHSPYVAASLNNLLYAGQLGTRDGGTDKAKVSSVVPEAYWLASKDFRAYRFGDGHVTSAMDPETQLIQADVIDSASNETGAVFDRLVELGERG